LKYLIKGQTNAQLDVIVVVKLDFSHFGVEMTRS
jgi:hypothetical protein